MDGLLCHWGPRSHALRGNAVCDAPRLHGSTRRNSWRAPNASIETRYAEGDLACVSRAVVRPEIEPVRIPRPRGDHGRETRSVADGIPTQSVGTRIRVTRLTAAGRP